MEKVDLDFNPPGQIFWKLSVYWTFKKDTNWDQMWSYVYRSGKNIEVNARS